MKSTVTLGVTIYRDDEDQSKNPMLKHEVNFGDAVLDRQKESHEMTVDFRPEHEVEVKVGAQVTVDPGGQIAFAHMVVFRGERAIGMMAAWVPLKHTSSFSVECLDVKGSIYSSVTLTLR